MSDTHEITTRIKALDNGDAWELDVLGIPYHGPYGGRDGHGEYFDASTRLHEERYGLPVVVHYHGYDASGQPAGSPEYIGKALSFEDRPDGRWYRVLLDKAHELAAQVWAAAQRGMAAVSSGTASHLSRVADNGHIDEWPVVELSLWDIANGNQPANTYAVAIPRMKALAIDNPTLQDALESEQENADGAATVTDGENGATTNLEEEKIMADEQNAVLAAIQGVAAQMTELNGRVKALEAVAPPDNPLKMAGAPAIIPDTAHWRYDNLSPGELALSIAVLRDAQRNGRSRRGVSDAAVKALAVRLESPTERRGVEGMNEAYGLMLRQSPGIKANEIAQSTLASYGDEWVGVAYGTELWESIRTGRPVLERQMRFAVPQPAGAETLYFPLESVDPVWYLVSQASALSADPGGVPTNTVPSSRLGTAQQSRTMAKIGARMLWTGELEEDAVVMYASELRRQLSESGSEMLESLLIDGDTATGATTNINDIAGTPAGTEYWLGLNGYRKLALVTNTANSRSGGAITSSDFLETIKLMGIGGKNALQKDRTAFIIDLHTHWKALELADVKTRDVFANATIENGTLTRIYGYDVLATENMHAPSAGSGYELKANTSGKIDQDTASNNTTGSILAVRFDQWRPGYRRQMTLETTRFAAADATEIVALMRFGMVYRDNEAAAISYNLTV